MPAYFIFSPASIRMTLSIDRSPCDLEISMNAPVSSAALAGSQPIAVSLSLTPALHDVMRERAVTCPTFCLSPRSARAGLAAFQHGFPGETTFAVKACPLPQAISLLADAGTTAFQVA
eukprot:gene4022-5310_t